MFACDERTSIVCARESVRGIASRLIAVTPCSASVAMRPGSMSGERSPTSAWPARRRPTSATVGFWTFTTQSTRPPRLVAGDERRARLLVHRVGIRRGCPGAALHEDVDPGRLQLGEDVRDQGNAVLAGQRLFRNADLHLGSLGWCKAAVRIANDPPRPHNRAVTPEDLRLFSADLLMTLLFGAAFVALFALHRWDLRRRRRRVAALRAAGEFGPNSAAVAAVVRPPPASTRPAAGRLSVERRRAFEWDPRLDKIPKVARHARDRAFASERDDVARAAADEARDAVTAALAGAPVEERVRARPPSAPPRPPARSPPPSGSPRPSSGC